MNLFSSKWPAWISGCLLALLLAGGTALFHADLGLHGLLLKIAGLCEEAVANGTLDDLLPEADWQCALCCGLLLGAFSAAAASGEFHFDAGAEGEGIHRIFSFLRNAAAGFFGGALLFGGMLIAGSGIWGEWYAASSGAGSGWVFLVTFLLVAILTAQTWDRGIGFAAPSAEGSPQTAKAPKAPKKAKKAKKGGKK